MPPTNESPASLEALADASDRYLVEAARAGSEDAATSLYQRYAHRLRAIVRSRFSPDLARLIDPDDVVQSVFRRFFGRVRAGDYSVPEGAELWQLLLVIAMNRLRSTEAFHHADKRDIGITLGGEHIDTLQRHLPRSHDAEGFLSLAVNDALDLLSPRHRRVAEMRLAQYDATEIAEAMGCSLRTVERLLQECRSRLQRCFHDPL